MSLGKSLINAKHRALTKGKILRDEKMLQLQILADEQQRREETNTGKKKLKSIWETNNLDDFLAVADERADGYTAARDVRVVVGGASHVVTRSKVVPLSDTRHDWIGLSAQLEIPHRPDWTFKMTPTELAVKEKSMFIEWRRKLAQLEESTSVLLTPYEKNLEVWRQLWRVIERSDVVVQIVDARNPLSFRCQDLERVVTSQNARHNPAQKKRMLLLLNKADLLHEEQRRAWAEYFTAQGINFLFFSAKPPEIVPVDADDDDGAEESEEEEAAPAATAPRRNAARRSDKRRLRGAPTHVDNIYALSKAAEKAEKVATAEREEAAKKAAQLEPTPEELERDARRKTLRFTHQAHDIVDAMTLLDVLAEMRDILGVPAEEQLMAGMVGYPNVGKSSTINALIKSHKVVVSATPGKTKHFQTLTIPEERRVMLCDCPGLVFPSFASTRESMVCDGVLPIDTVKDYVSPVVLVCRRVPQILLEHMYHVVIEKEMDVDDSSSPAELLLNFVARRRGYMSDHDKPNRSKAAKDILKDYVDGRIVFVHPPPGYQPPAADALAHGAHDEVDSQPPGAASAVSRHADPAAAHDDEDAIPDDDWEDVDSADEARNMSDSEDDDDEAADPGAPEENPVLFFDTGLKAGAKVVKSRHVTAAEAFNGVRNMEVCDELAALEEARPRRKAARNPQYEPDPFVRVTQQGATELLIDSDDDIVAIQGGEQKAERGPSKRQLRRAAKHGTGAGVAMLSAGAAAAIAKRKPVSLKVDKN